MRKSNDKAVDFTEMSRDDMQNLIMKLMDRNSALEAECDYYLMLLKQQRAKMFGRSTEKTDELQLDFFNEMEADSEPEAAEPELSDCVERAPAKKKKKGAKKEHVKKLPVQRIEYTLDENEAICEHCGARLSHMKKVVRKELTVIPAQIYVTEHIQHVYVCRNCSNNGIEANIAKAAGPEPVLRNSLASPSMISWIMTRKFVDSVPLYRQEQQHLRDGLKLTRQTMANWQMRATELYLEPLYQLMHKYFVKRSVIHADETVLEVLQEPGREAAANSYMWVFSTCAADTIPMTLYEYSQSRAHTVPEEFLSGFRGYLISDGYDAYKTLSRKHPEIINVNCWAHVKRKYTDIVKALGKEVDPGKTESSKAIRVIDELFRVEREIAGKSADEKRKIRQEKALPKVDAYFAWAKDILPQSVGRSSFAKAVSYSLEREEELRRYLEDGRLEISNNRAEREVKKFVIGRKNWIFNNTPRGARCSAIAYSVIVSALMNGLDPFRYLAYIFSALAGKALLTDEELECYLPWSDKLPEEIRSKQEFTDDEHAASAEDPTCNPNSTC